MTKVLVVEDDPQSMELVFDILRAHGFTVDCAQNGEEAFKKAEKGVYDLILMDIALPEMDGVEVTKIIKSKPRHKNTPVIAMTAHDILMKVSSFKKRFLDAGFADYITKPIDMPEFVKKIERYKQ